ncbi:MAG TPA: MBOAT family O-acyltransferase [Terriglobales bacterium]|nr:MBOAT family O-acyltransferase [Terriglobales bacterium]
MLLAASCIFYMAFIPFYIFILFVTILIDYFLGIRIEEAQNPKRKKSLLILSIVSTCAVLFVFKYFNFFAQSGNQLQMMMGLPATLPLANIILPIGLSFHTFQSLSYVIEVYRGRQTAERNFGIYSLYVMFYPQLVAGPIERPQRLLHQFYEQHKFKVENLANGLLMIAWGFFKKMVVADRAAVYVNTVYGDGWRDQSGSALLMATLLFAVQIYADFSGYSSIAVGCARLMGFQLMRNFHHPYFASGVADFWVRWHISLSTWFRDYVYVPLGGNRVSLPRHYANLLITFAISGLWHGANWTFVVWGVYNGVLLIIEQLSASWFARARIVRGLWRALAVSAVVLGWVFFRAANMEQATGILRRIFSLWHFDKATAQAVVLQFAGDNTSLGVAFVTLGMIAAMLAVEWMMEYRGWSRSIANPAGSLRLKGAVTVLLFQLIMLFGVLRSSSFIYFQF